MSPQQTLGRSAPALSDCRGVGLLPSDQGEELKARFARFMREGDVPAPGDLVYRDEGLGDPRALNFGQTLFIVVRNLWWESEDDRDLIRRWRVDHPLSCPDCLVWSLPAGGAGVETWLFDSRELVIVRPAAERGRP